jgi:hypothetical protein
MLASVFNFWGTAGSENFLKLHQVKVTLPGPYFVAPPGRENNTFPGGTPSLNWVALAPTSVLTGNGTPSDSFPAGVAAMAAHPQQQDLLLVGLDTGDVYRATTGSSGGTFELAIAAPVHDAVTAICFQDPRTVWLGYANGVAVRLVDPFGAPTATLLTPASVTSSGTPVVALDLLDNGVVVAQSDAIALISASGAMTDLTAPYDSGLYQQLQQGDAPTIQGICADAAHGYLYVTTGLIGGSVWRRSTRSSTSTPWQTFDTGLPTNLPLTGIGISPQRGVFASTKGRGIWWRRDIA